MLYRLNFKFKQENMVKIKVFFRKILTQIKNLFGEITKRVTAKQKVNLKEGGEK